MDQIALKNIKWFYFLLVTVILAICGYNCSRVATTYSSLDPQNEYVGTEACQPCHAKITDTYLQTGMGKSMYRPDPQNIIERFGSQEFVYDSAVDMNYVALWKGNEMFVREYRLKENDTVHDRWEKIDYVVGSGHQTRSYLLERNGYIYEAPITWYVNKQIWDLSPGYDINNARFDREIGLTCMACHTGYVGYVAESKNRYRFVSEGIDCEKCHGPGADHIRRIDGGQMIDVGMEIDYSIVNPAKLPLQQQFDICQQCHLQGINVLKDEKEMADFRPAMLLKELGDVFVERDPNQNAFGIASHAQRLQQSDCFIQSEGKLNCTTCHDPHKSISVTEKDVYIKQCQSCHQQGMKKLCSVEESLSLAKESNCISCHMPSGGTNDIPHVSFHDHYIRVVEPMDSLKIEEIEGIVELVCGTDSQPEPQVEASAWLSYFETQNRAEDVRLEVEKRQPNLSSYDNARFLFYQGKPQEAKHALDLIPQNEKIPLVLFLEGEIEESLGNFEKAHQIFLSLYQGNSERWDAGLKAGVSLLKARQGDFSVLDQAEDLFLQLQKQKPFDTRIKTNLAFIAINRKEYRKAESLLVRSLNQDPDNLNALENMLYLQYLRRNSVQAKLYYDRIKEKYPEYRRLGELEELL